MNGTEAHRHVFRIRDKIRNFQWWRTSMPPRKPELPEGTDRIDSGAMETGSGSTITGSSGSGATSVSTSGGAGGTRSTGSTSGGNSSGFIATGSGNDTGGTRSKNDGVTDKVVSQLKEGAASLRDQATGKVRDFAQDGKSRATDMLDEFSQVIDETAQSIDQHLGSDYGEYARRASSVVSDFSRRIREREVDEIYDDVQNVVRKSPVVALSAATIVGFALVRLVKTGLDDVSGRTNQGERTRGNRRSGGGNATEI
jgi:uncharacterized protein YjbJ (UPF0337 family)